MIGERITFTSAEVAAYYAARVSAVRQANASRWRGPCPIHRGKDNNFSVDPATGRWFCHSQCSRGGSLIDLEIELTGSDFRTAKAAVFDLIGRPPDPGPTVTRHQRRDALAQAQRARHEAERARAWASGVLADANFLLESLKVDLSRVPEPDFDSHGDLIGAVHRLAATVRALHGLDLITAFQRQLAHDRFGTEHTVQAALADAVRARAVTVACVRLLELSLQTREAA